ncbi:MAG: 8-oxoguanine deaminase [Phycisphaerae bacterium]|nr:8-oxoguanine deaminase [Phycisphaerae bacterium]
MSDAQIIHADAAYVENELVEHVQVVVRDGQIADVGAQCDAASVRLSGRALLPGLVNAHSHAFQVGLRGQAEYYPPEGGDFWSWREEMYRLVERTGGEEFERLCRAAFEEMLSAGITTVGEFHYFHHDANHRGYAMDERVRRAAAAAGIRLVLLQSYYATGAIGRPLAGGQRHFDSRPLDAFWKQLEALRATLDTRREHIGVAPHSIRAVPPDQLVELRRLAPPEMPFHIHVEEQTREIEECIAAYGSSPLEFLIRNRVPGAGMTAVHCTHSRPEAMSRFLAEGGRVCVCPLTEGNLGDGIADLDTILARAGGAVCIGTDSNVRIDLLEELRWLEFVQRLRRRRRGATAPPDGRLARQLLRCATENGAAALAVATGALRAGLAADMITVDLSDADRRSAPPDALLNRLIFSGSAADIRDVMVAGRWVRGPAQR